MSVSLQPDPSYPNRMFAWQKSDFGVVSAEIGLQLPGEGSSAPDIVFFWLGSFNPTMIQHNVDKAEQSLRAKWSIISRRVVAYGKQREERVPPISEASLGTFCFSQLPYSSYRVYRFEILSMAGGFKFWVNTEIGTGTNLAENGENISLAFAPSLFRQMGDSLVLDAVMQTRPEAKVPLNELLGVVGRELRG